MEDWPDPRCAWCGEPTWSPERFFCSEGCERAEREHEEKHPTGTCGGCGRYGPYGQSCFRPCYEEDGQLEECGQFV
jgi:hypothetical protein